MPFLFPLSRRRMLALAASHGVYSYNLLFVPAWVALVSAVIVSVICNTLAGLFQPSPGGPLPDIGNVVEKNYKPLVLRLQNLRVPTIAAVNGIAAGAGASVALACDIVVAARSASFLQAFSKIGLVPDTGGTWFLPQRVGMARAMGLAMLADKLPAEKAADWGLIWAAYEDAEFAAKVDALAAQLAAMPTKALVRTRQAMHAAPGHTLEQQLSFEGGFMRELGWSPDYAEGVAAFMEKRAPKFTGE